MLKSGDKLVVIKSFITRANGVYYVGDVLELIEPTGQDPFGFYGQSHNWVVKCRYFEPPDPRSIWAGIQHCIDVGFICLMSTKDTR